MAIERLRTRRSTTKTVPSSSDLELSEQGYTFQNGKLWIKNQITGEIDCIGGKAIVDMVMAMNRLPIVQAAMQAAQDTQASWGGNLITLANASDPDGDTLTVQRVNYSGTDRPMGVTFNTTHGQMIVQPDGSYSFFLNDAARALQAGQQASVQVTVTLADGRGGLSTYPVTINITGTNQAPVVGADLALVRFGASWSGNILANDSDPEGTPITLVGYTMEGLGAQTLGASVQMAGKGTFSLSAAGLASFTPENGSTYFGPLPTVTYTVSDGVNQTTGTLRISVARPAPTEAETMAYYASYRTPPVITNPAPNPPPSRPLPDRSTVNTFTPWDYSLPLPNQRQRPANALDFEVGPGKPYADPSEVPTEYLLPGDRVFVYARPTPYKNIVGVSTSGTEEAWIEWIGVADPVTGAMPVFDGDGAISKPTDRYFGDHECAGMFIIGPINTGADGQVAGNKPRFVHITGFRVINAHPTRTRFNRSGQSGAWGDFACAFYARGADNITIMGNEISHCGNGIFVNSTTVSFPERLQSRAFHICNNWIHHCSVLESFHVHSAYLEGINFIYEHNVMEQVIPGSFGDTLKERSSGLVVRYNLIHTSANALSLRDPTTRNTSHGFYEASNVDYWGELTVKSVFVYGNTFVCRDKVDAIISAGDGADAQLREGSVYFYSNVVIIQRDPISGDWANVSYNPFRTVLFDIWNTRAALNYVVRNNLFYSGRVTPGSMVTPFGIFNFFGSIDAQTNWINRFTPTALEGPYGAKVPSPRFTGAGLGGLTESTDDPGFKNFSLGDFRLLPSSPFFSLNAPVPAAAVTRGLIPTRTSVLYPFSKMPRPSLVTPPAITGSAVAGNRLTRTPGVWFPVPDSVQVRWLRNGVPIDGATGDYYDTVNAVDAEKGISIEEIAVSSEAGPSAPGYSSALMIVTASTPQNQSAPVVSGSLQVTFPQTVSTGSWTNAPDRYEYQALLNGAAVPAPEGVTLPFVPVAGDVGKTLQWRVRAFNGAEYGEALSNVVTLTAVSTDPDALNNRWNFDAADGTTLATLSAATIAKWQGEVTGYGNANTHYACDGSGGLVVEFYYAANNASIFWLENSQSDMTGVEANFTLDAGSAVCLRYNATQGYRFEVTQGQVRVWRNGVYPPTKSVNLATPAGSMTLKVVPTAVGTFEIYVNGALADTYVDPTPLAGGYPGACFQSGVMHWWTDTPT